MTVALKVRDESASGSLLTDAERRTGTYSNRFAAHVLRQHQFSNLCAARGWKNRLRLMVDDAFPPAARELPV